MDPLTLRNLAGLAAAVWTVWTWKEEQHKGRQVSRDRASARFVTAFLIAAQDLQSALYRVLEEDELRAIKEDEPELEDHAAIGLLYRFGLYFGWGLSLVRFGPYTRDPKLMGFISKISDAFETRTRFSGRAFRFSLDERIALGVACVRRLGSDSADFPVFQSITRVEFEQGLRTADDPIAVLLGRGGFRATIEAIRRTDRVGDLEGFDRLVALQHALIDLIAYLERKEGFKISSVGAGKAAARAQGRITVLHQVPGRIRLAVPDLEEDPSIAARLQSRLSSIGHVNSVRVNVDAACVVIGHCPDVSQSLMTSTVVQAAEEALAH